MEKRGLTREKMKSRITRRVQTTLEEGSTAPYSIANETVGFLLWESSRRFVRVFSDCLAQHGIKFGVWPVLRTLWENDGLTQRELAERLNVSGPTLVKVVAELERDGLVMRKADPGDKRRAPLFLTPPGRNVVFKILPSVEVQNKAGLRGFTDQEEQELKEFLRRLRANMDEF